MTQSHVTSQSLSMRLKEAGVPQTSHFYWAKRVFANAPPVDPWILLDCVDTHALENVSAFLASELGEMLPPEYYTRKFGKNPVKWLPHKTIDASFEGEVSENSSFHGCIAATEADARAKMLLHLIERGLIKFEN